MQTQEIKTAIIDAYEPNLSRAEKKATRKILIEAKQALVRNPTHTFHPEISMALEHLKPSTNIWLVPVVIMLAGWLFLIYLPSTRDFVLGASEPVCNETIHPQENGKANQSTTPAPADSEEHLEE